MIILLGVRLKGVTNQPGPVLERHVVARVVLENSTFCHPFVRIHVWNANVEPVRPGLLVLPGPGAALPATTTFDVRQHHPATARCVLVAPDLERLLSIWVHPVNSFVCNSCECDDVIRRVHTCQQYACVAGYRTERSRVGCFSFAPLEVRSSLRRSNPSASPRRFSRLKCIMVGNWEKGDSAERERADAWSAQQSNGAAGRLNQINK